MTRPDSCPSHQPFPVSADTRKPAGFPPTQTRAQQEAPSMGWDRVGGGLLGSWGEAGAVFIPVCHGQLGAISCSPGALGGKPRACLFWKMAARRIPAALGSHPHPFFSSTAGPEESQLGDTFSSFCESSRSDRRVPLEREGRRGQEAVMRV